MTLNSIQFVVFLSICVLIYYLIPAKCRYLFLLISSWVFYAAYDLSFLIWILLSIGSSYICALLMANDVGRKKIYAVIGAGTSIVLLLYFKYGNFIIDNFIGFFSFFNLNIPVNKKDIIIPIAISYYTLQVIAYIFDVYYSKIEPEKNFFKYALFISFFPKLISGPIEKPSTFLEEIHRNDKGKGRGQNLYNIWGGVLLFIFGLFTKMVIADRIAVIANTVFKHFYIYGSFELFIGMIAYSIQIYSDFYSYSLMALGMSKMFGYTVTNNFNAPYFSRSIKEFWRRWHISLSQWLKDYIYIPLGGNRCNVLCRYRNLFITFLVSGIWHGASWNYVFWGGLHGIYQIIGSIIAPYRAKVEKQIKSSSISYKLGKVLTTYLLVSFAWIFFRIDNFSEGLFFIKRLFTKINLWAIFDGSLFTLGLDAKEIAILIIGLIVVFLVDIVLFRTKKTVDLFIEEQTLLFQIMFTVGLVVSIILFGAYGEGYIENQFIYFQF